MTIIPRAQALPAYAACFHLELEPFHSQFINLAFVCRHFLRMLRDHQVAVKMMDESAVEVVREYARSHVEARLLKALTQIKLVGECTYLVF